MSLLVTANMASPIAGEAPHFDALLEYEMAQRLGLSNKLRRDLPSPPPGAIHVPMVRRVVFSCMACPSLQIGHTYRLHASHKPPFVLYDGKSFIEHWTSNRWDNLASSPRIVPADEVREWYEVWSVACCSSPIYAAETESVEHVAKRLSVEHASELAPDARNVVATGNGTYKSYRLPLQIRRVPKIAWFVWGHRRPIRSLLKSIASLGKKRSLGYGIVKEWTLEHIPEDQCHFWFAPSESGPVLMRPLPRTNSLPENLLGFKHDFGACLPPYWHGERYSEIVVPC